MRKRSIMLAAAVIATVSVPTRAQYVSPFSGNWLLGSAVSADAMFGSASSGKREPKTECASVPNGRDGLRYHCTVVPDPAATASK